MDDLGRRTNRLVLALLVTAMCASATWLMLVGRDLSFSGDELFYYAHFVGDGAKLAPGHGLEYFLAPHNGHLVLLGKLIYEGLFRAFGTDYAVFRAVEVAALLLCVSLFFVLARRRVGAFAAVIPSVLLLFLGYAGESLLWPFDLHSLLSLAFGLMALLMFEREDRRGDLAACAFLVLSISAVEIGLAFSVGAAIWIMLGPDRWRRIWIVAVPVIYFGIWLLWARKFGQPTIELANVRLIPIGLANSLAAVSGSIFGLNPTGTGIAPYVTTVSVWGTVIAGAAAVGLLYRIGRGDVPRELWVSLSIVLTYWLMMALAGRPPDSSRYIFVGTLMVLLTAVNALRGTRVTTAALIVASCLAVLAIPPNIAKLYDQQGPLVEDADRARTEYAMFELARQRAVLDYITTTDQNVNAVSRAPLIALSAGEYLRAADEFGSLAPPLDEVRGASLDLRRVADATLVGALGTDLVPKSPSPAPGHCRASLGGRPDQATFFFLPPGGALLGSRLKRPIEVAVGRFGREGPGQSLGKLAPGGWARLAVPVDSTPDRWWAIVNGPLDVCSL
jgi:hypothetical protein